MTEYNLNENESTIYFNLTTQIKRIELISILSRYGFSRIICVCRHKKFFIQEDPFFTNYRQKNKQKD